MEVLFETKRLHKRLGTSRSRQKEFGAEAAKKIALRLESLAACSSLADMRQLPGRCHELTGDWAGHLAVDLQHPMRLVFRPTRSETTVKPDGGMDWRAVESVTIVEIIDYH